MFDDQMAMQLSQGRGLGLADMLVQPADAGAAWLELRAAAGQRHAGALFRRRAGASSLRARSLRPRHDFVRTMLAARRAGGARARRRSARAARAGRARNRLGQVRAVQRARASAASICSASRPAASGRARRVNVPTLEFEEGVAVRKVERFRAYDSPADSFRDYAASDRATARVMPMPRGAGDDVAAFASALQQGGYATDPTTPARSSRREKMRAARSPNSSPAPRDRSQLQESRRDAAGRHYVLHLADSYAAWMQRHG